MRTGERRLDSPPSPLPTTFLSLHFSLPPFPLLLSAFSSFLSYHLASFILPTLRPTTSPMLPPFPPHQSPTILRVLLLFVSDFVPVFVLVLVIATVIVVVITVAVIIVAHTQQSACARAILRESFDKVPRTSWPSLNGSERSFARLAVARCARASRPSSFSFSRDIRRHADGTALRKRRLRPLVRTRLIHASRPLTYLRAGCSEGREEGEIRDARWTIVCRGPEKRRRTIEERKQCLKKPSRRRAE